jgi:hypothetical protein
MTSHHSEEEIREADKKSKDILDSFCSEALEDIQRESKEQKRGSLGKQQQQDGREQQGKKLVDFVNLENYDDHRQGGQEAGRDRAGEVGDHEVVEEEHSENEGDEGVHEEEDEERQRQEMRRVEKEGYMKTGPSSFGGGHEQGVIEEVDDNEYLDRERPGRAGDLGFPQTGPSSSHRGTRRLIDDSRRERA